MWPTHGLVLVDVVPVKLVPAPVAGEDTLNEFLVADAAVVYLVPELDAQGDLFLQQRRQEVGGRPEALNAKPLIHEPVEKTRAKGKAVQDKHATRVPRSLIRVFPPPVFISITTSGFVRFACQSFNASACGPQMFSTGPRRVRVEKIRSGSVVIDRLGGESFSPASFPGFIPPSLPPPSPSDAQLCSPIGLRTPACGPKHMRPCIELTQVLSWDCAMATAIPASVARMQLGALLKQAAEKRVRFVITKAGKPTAVLLSIADFDDMLEELEPEFQKSLKSAAGEYRRGKAVDLAAYMRNRPRRRRSG
ncbi:MAG: type II toxin-antitoxin system Phd/YefM family antitoxin [Anaerolineae bacterium]|nr:type II toxin-antitoxin system Phd/YefM family antitoxin [Anaerolineae bacterium]